MRDLFTIAAAGAVLTAYAVLVPSLVEAEPGSAAPQKAFTQRLPQAGGAVPVSQRLEGTETVEGRLFVARRPLVVGISAGGASR